MWKYITRNVRENLERRICTSLTDRSNQDAPQCKIDKKYTAPSFFVGGKYVATVDEDSEKQKIPKHNGHRRNCDNKHDEERTQQRSWSAAHQVRQSWLNALGWSTALVLSWNLVQPLCKSVSENKHRCPFGRRLPPFMCWKSKKFNHFRQAHWQSKHRFPFQDETDDDWRTKFDSRSFCAYQDGPEGKWGFKHTPPDIHAWQDEVDTKWNEENEPRLQKTESISRQDSSYASIWRLLSNTVFAQPSHILPKRAETQNQKIQVQNVEVTEYGPPTAEQALDDAANQFAEAQRTVMGDLDNRVGVELMQSGNHHEAVTMFTRAAENDNAAAAYNLGVCHEMGLGTNQNFKEAAKYYQLASKRGHATAMYNLGVFHVHGWGGLPADCDRARELFQNASDLGQPDAKKALGMAKGEVHPLASGVDEPEGSVHLVMQALGVAEKIILNGASNDKGQQDHLDIAMGSSDHKDISDLVHNSILKYTELLQK